MKPDFGKTAEDYASHRAGFPDSLYRRLGEFGVGKPDQSVVDLGTGTGNMARSFAKLGCHVIGVDIAEALVEKAKNLDKDAGVTVEYTVGRAESTGLNNATADVVSAGQCWHWFDRPAATMEAARILKPDGKIVIAHMDWLPIADNIVALTEKLILEHNPAWNMSGGIGIYPQWLRDLDEAGYTNIESFTYDLAIPYTHFSWRGRIRASAGISASLPSDKVAVFDLALAELLTSQFSNEPLMILHRVFAVVADRPK